MQRRTGIIPRIGSQTIHPSIYSCLSTTPLVSEIEGQQFYWYCLCRHTQYSRGHKALTCLCRITPLSGTFHQHRESSPCQERRWVMSHKLRNGVQRVGTFLHCTQGSGGSCAYIIHTPFDYRNILVDFTTR